MRQAPDRLAGIVEVDETFILESRKGEWKLDHKPRRAGETLSHTLPAINADSVKEGLEPVVAPDALLVSDANRCYPPVAAALDIPHESINASASQRVRGAAHPDGQ